MSYNYPNHGGGYDDRAQPEPPLPRLTMGQNRGEAPGRPRSLRGIAEYRAVVWRAESLGRRLGLSRTVVTNRGAPFACLGRPLSAADLRGILREYSDGFYIPGGLEDGYVQDFCRGLKEVANKIEISWAGAELCVGRQASEFWTKSLDVFTGILEGGNELYEKIQTFITNCERAMGAHAYDASGRLRANAKRRFMDAFIDSPDRVRLIDDMRNWIRAATGLGGSPEARLRDARQEAEYEREQELARQEQETQEQEEYQWRGRAYARWSRRS